MIIKIRLRVIVFSVSLFYCSQSFSETKIFIECNVTRSDIPEESNFTTEKEKLAGVITKYHGNKNFTFKVSFIDPSPYPSYIQWLVDWWNSVVGEGEEEPADVEILFILTDQDKWRYEGIKFKPQFFFKDYYLEKIQEYVNEHVFQGANTEKILVTRWLKAITNILDQQYKQRLLTEGANLITVSGYQRGHRLSEWMSASFNYNLEPYSIDSTLTKNTSYISNLNEAAGRYLKTINSYFDQFDYHNPYQTINELETKIWKKIAEREDYKNKIPNHILDDSKIKEDTLFHLKDRDEQTKQYRLKFTKTPVGNNEEYNFLSDLIGFGWRHTSCNFFAFDLQRKVWGKFLWLPDSAQATSTISAYLPSDPNFKEIPVIEASKYAEYGFYVICVKSGHVTTMYPDKIRNPEATNYGYVVQAGDKIGNTFFLNKIWSKEEFKEVRAYIYLGYLFQ